MVITGENQERLLNLLENLTTFIEESTKLMVHLKAALEGGNNPQAPQAPQVPQVPQITVTPAEEEDCPCADEVSVDETKLTVPKTGSGNVSAKSSTDSKTEQVKSAQKKQQFVKEKSQRMQVLKESLAISQSHLHDIQEQIRQIDRLYEDYESFNGKTGQVNPAALYKEIMKPQSVPFIGKPPKVVQIQRPATRAEPLGRRLQMVSTSAGSANVAILSAVPLDQNLF